MVGEEDEEEWCWFLDEDRDVSSVPYSSPWTQDCITQE